MSDSVAAARPHPSPHDSDLAEPPIGFHVTCRNCGQAITQNVKGDWYHLHHGSDWCLP